MIEGISQIDNSSKINVFEDDGSKSKGDRKGSREKVLNIVLLIFVFVLIGLFAYMFFTDRLIVGVENPFSTGVVDKEVAVEEEISKTGEFHIKMEYPSEYLPPYRICFSNLRDISKVHCFVDNGSEESSTEYENTIIDGVGVLPVGDYTMEYRLLDGVDYYIWNPCVKSLNGDEITDSSVCLDFYNKLKESYLYLEGMNFNSSIINLYGGEPIIITIEEDKRTEIGDIASMPYFNYDYLLNSQD